MSAARRLPDRVRIHPATLSGAITVTGDKSIGHRCLLLGVLADGPVEVSGLPPSADVAATADALRRLGADVQLECAADGRLMGIVAGGSDGSDGPFPPTASGPVAIDCGNSGTTLRLLAGLAAGSGRHVVLDGDASLRRRPVDRIRAPLAAMGTVTRAREDRLPPLEVLPGQVHSVRWVSAVASAQVKSAVLLAAVAGGVSAEIESPHPSRDHTERMLRHGAVSVATSISDDGREVVQLTPGRPTYRVLRAPRDPSAAAFWHVAAACGVGTLETPDLCLNPGRTGALDVLRSFGARVTVTNQRDEFGEPVGDVAVSSLTLGNAEVSGELVVRCLDELPALALAGAMSDGGLVVRDAEELRVKESDRIHVLATTLAALGVRVEERPDGFTVPGGQRPGPGRVDAHGDHRIAMTAAIAACLGTGPVEIAGFAAVGTSYPGFLDDLVALGGRAETIDG
jgi:3-phosphoshikimate 1-carboxyvinyltransferase